MYNLGANSLEYLESIGQQNTGDWHHYFVNMVGYDANSFIAKLWFGACYFLPIYFVVFTVGIAWEALFAIVRKHEINEGAFVSTVLFSLSCPPDIPLWQAAMGISFGLVIGKEIFGGTGKNFLNPALTGRAFLYFAYPAQISGDKVWVAGISDYNIIPEGYSGATALGMAAESGMAGITNSYTWMDAFLGNIPGSVGETSIIAILIGMVILLMTKVASYRIILGTFIGMILMSSILNIVGSETNQMFYIPWYWHAVIGSFAFGLVFMATEPVSGSGTNTLYIMNESIIKTLAVAFSVCLVCSLIVSASAVSLRDLQKENKLNDKRLKVLQVAGIYDQNISISDQFNQLESKFIDFDSGMLMAEYNNFNIDEYDQVVVTKDPALSSEVPASEDIAIIKNRENVGKIYILRDDLDNIKKLILPIRGYGLWGTLYGYIAIESDFNTVSGIEFYDHKETPGLGAEVDNPRWKSSWKGKKIYNNDQVALEVIKGKVDTGDIESEYKIDGLSGATITSRGVTNMVSYWFSDSGYANLLKELNYES